MEGDYVLWIFQISQKYNRKQARKLTVLYDDSRIEEHFLKTNTFLVIYFENVDVFDKSSGLTLVDDIKTS